MLGRGINSPVPRRHTMYACISLSVLVWGLNEECCIKSISWSGWYIYEKKAFRYIVLHGIVLGTLVLHSVVSGTLVPHSVV